MCLLGTACNAMPLTVIKDMLWIIDCILLLLGTASACEKSSVDAYLWCRSA